MDHCWQSNFSLAFLNWQDSHSKIMLLLLLSCFSHVQLCATPWTAAYQDSPSMGFSRQEYWSGVPLPSPKDYEETINSKHQWKQQLPIGSQSVQSIFLRFIFMWTLLKVLIEFVQYCFCFTFWFFGCKACGILASWLGIEPHTPCIGRWNLSHWTSREVPSWSLLVSLLWTKPRSGKFLIGTIPIRL